MLMMGISRLHRESGKAKKQKVNKDKTIIINLWGILLEVTYGFHAGSVMLNNETQSIWFVNERVIT